MAYNDRLQLLAWSRDGRKTEDITELIQTQQWSGSYQDCARKLNYHLRTDGLSDLGGQVWLKHNGETLLSGTVFRRERSNEDQVFSCTAYDRGIYLKKNSTYLAVRNQTPEAVCAKLCGEYGISVGSLATTGVTLSRNFLGTTLYQIIQTLYTLAAEQNGKKYQIRFQGEKLHVVEKALGTQSLRLVPGSNLLSCKTVESIENLVTTVGVYDDQSKRIATYESSDNYRALYGLMQEAIRASDKDDPAASAKQILEDNGVKTTITAQCLGNVKLVTGNAVVVHEPITGTDGLFWILEDQHTVSRGIYQTQLTLDFRNLMDKRTAGSVPTD
jgi:hypothetical protein